MEELWRGSNECLVFGLAKADDMVARTSSISASREKAGRTLCVVKKRRI
jgi:hypothetical protein